MNVIIEIDGVRHRMVESDGVCFCDGAMNTAVCSLRPYCIGANQCTSEASIMKFCLMFPHKGRTAYFQRVKKHD